MIHLHEVITHFKACNSDFDREKFPKMKLVFFSFFMTMDFFLMKKKVQSSHVLVINKSKYNEYCFDRWERFFFNNNHIFIKVFRFQRKTLLLFFGFFFFIIIKVFRLNGRPYCYSSVSFSLLLLLRSSVSTEDLTVILRFLFLYYY